MKKWILLLGIVCPFSAQAWESHFLLTWAALKNMTEIASAPAVPTESLSTFLEKEKSGLKKLLKENEKWANEHVYAYPSLPEELAFENAVDRDQPVVQAFLQSLRVNPAMRFPVYLQVPPGVVPRLNDALPRIVVMLPGLVSEPGVRIANAPLQNVKLGDAMFPLEIISAAADEPDYGMDIGVWKDNYTKFGQRYEFGYQPFGDPAVYYSSQAPFHFGLFYESPLVYWFAPGFHKCYIEYRVHTYLTLSRYAFNKGHPYWGYRFLGWALHYIQDLTQPYHSTLVPGSNLAEMIGADVLDKIGIHKFRQNMVRFTNNQHFALENYAYFKMRDAVKQDSLDNPMIRAITDQAHDKTYPAYDDNYLRDVIGKESHDRSATVVKLMEEAFPSLYIDDSSYYFYHTEPSINLLDVINDTSLPAVKKFDALLGTLFQSVGSHTRNAVKSVLDQE